MTVDELVAEVVKEFGQLAGNTSLVKEWINGVWKQVASLLGGEPACKETTLDSSDRIEEGVYRMTEHSIRVENVCPAGVGSESGRALRVRKEQFGRLKLLLPANNPYHVWYAMPDFTEGDANWRIYIHPDPGSICVKYVPSTPDETMPLPAHLVAPLRDGVLLRAAEAVKDMERVQYYANKYNAWLGIGAGGSSGGSAGGGK